MELLGLFSETIVWQEAFFWLCGMAQQPNLRLGREGAKSCVASPVKVTFPKPAVGEKGIFTESDTRASSPGAAGVVGKNNRTVPNNSAPEKKLWYMLNYLAVYDKHPFVRLAVLINLLEVVKEDSASIS